MNSHVAAFMILGGVLLGTWGCIWIIYRINLLYKAGVRKPISFNKKRRGAIDNIVECIHKNPASWKIDIGEYMSNSGFRNIDITNDNDIKIVFEVNLMVNSKFRRDVNIQKHDAFFIALTLEERIRLKSAYKFLVKWNKNKVENESIDKFYISSTGFDEL